MKRVRIKEPRENRVRGFGVLRRGPGFICSKQDEYLVKDESVTLLEKNQIAFETL